MKSLLALLTLLLISAYSYGQAWSGILASERAIDWTNAGIPGGIPSRATVCASLTAGASTATIQSAINACPAGQVVSFGAGTFTITTSIYANKGITLRGQGPTQTTIVQSGGNILLGIGSGGQGAWPGSPVQTSWTGGLTRGSTVLTVASTTNLRAGQVVILDELNPAWVFTTGVEGACTSGNSCGRNSSPAGFSGSSTRAAAQLTKIVSVDSSTQITIRDPVGYTRTSGLTPQVFSWSNGGTYGNVQQAGIENMKVNASGNDFAISFPFCDYCWAKNVEIYNAGRSAVWFYYSYGGVLRDSYLWNTAATCGPTKYGLDANMSSKQLVENNIFYNICSSIVPETVYGVVFGYNYMHNNVADNLFASFTGHLSHSSFNLLEGNVGNTLTWDNSWGSSSHNTMFRNRSDGVGENKTNYRFPIGIYAHQRFHNLVGNVLGTTSFHTVYSCDETNATGDNEGHIYDIGNWNGCGTPSTYDSVTRTSLMRWGNWDAVTWIDNGNTNGIRYCTGSGAGNAECTASETANSDPTFPGLSSPSTTFPASFYTGVTSAHASCGTGLSFWKNPGDGTCPPYPAIGPDVSCSSNCTANTGSHVAKIPALRCYENSTKDGSGYLTAFDAATCYTLDSGSGAPSAPTNFRTVMLWQ